MKNLGKRLIRQFAKANIPINAHKATLLPHLELDEVPKLPVPPIEETIERYKKCIEPICSEEEYNEALGHIEYFLQNEAEDLQNDLFQLAEETPTSYLEGFWDHMYMTYGLPHPTNINPYFVVRPFTQDGLEAAVQTLCAAGAFHVSIADGSLPNEYEGKDIPLCMSQYRNLFSMARIADPNGKDYLLKYPESTHAVVVRNNQFYGIELVDDDLNLIGDDLIREQVIKIMEDAENSDAEAIGSLTTQYRVPWGEQRTALCEESEVNKLAFEDIDKGLFVMSFFDDTPDDLEAFSRILCHSDGRSCWYDKFQIYVTNNGWVGFNMEHSGFDGHTILNLGTVILNHEPKTSAHDSDNLLRRIDFEKTELTKKYVTTATEEFDQVIATTQTALCEYFEYGKGFIKKHRCSPDAYVQMCFQLAYYRVHNEMGSTYESALTKKWFHGRTGTVRSTSPESKVLCEVFYDETSSDGEKIAAFKKAIETQVIRSIEAKNGKCVDRHLFALYNLAKVRNIKFPGYEIPEIFSDSAYQNMKYDNMSTSNCGTDDIILFGFGPVVPKGYGLGYVVNENRICVNVTSFRGLANEFRESLIQTFGEVRDLFERAHVVE